MPKLWNIALGLIILFLAFFYGETAPIWMPITNLFLGLAVIIFALFQKDDLL